MQIYGALQLGRVDNTSMSTITCMIYYTPDFKNIVTDPTLYIEYLIRGANGIFENSQVPLRLKEFCIQEVDIIELSLSALRLGAGDIRLHDHP